MAMSKAMLRRTKTFSFVGQFEINQFDTFGDKPQCSALGNQSRKPEGLKRGFDKGLVALSVNPEDAKYREQAPMLAIGVFRRVDKIGVIIYTYRCKIIH